MKFRNCQMPHNPPASYGDCVRACIATITDRDDVPHCFGNRSVTESWALLREWLASIGKSLALIASADDPSEFMRTENDGVTYMLMGRTAAGNNHAVVCYNGQVMHNPDPTKPPLVRPCDIGAYVIAFVGDAVV